MNRIAVGLVFGLIVTPIVLYIYDYKPEKPKWKVAGCSVVSDDRDSNIQKIRLALHGPTRIEVELYVKDSCSIPVGTVFTDRDGGSVCTDPKNVPSDISPIHCFPIVSETQR